MKFTDALDREEWLALGEPSVSDVRLESVAVAHARFDAMARPKRAALLGALAVALKSKDALSSEDFRIALLKLVIGLLPDSLALIREIVLDERANYDPEVRFSLFCFLDEVPGLSLGDEIGRNICQTVTTYLCNVRSDAGMAAWMAGDLLGEHWPAKPGVTALCEVAKGARFVAGRHSAIHGLAHAMGRMPELDGFIRTTLTEVACNDRSERVRREAQEVLDGRHSCASVKLNAC